MEYERTEKNPLVFGIRPVIEAIREGKEIERLFIQNGLSSEVSGELRQLIKEFGLAFQYVPIEKLNRLTRKNHQGVAAFISPVSYQQVENVLPAVFESGKVPLVIILDRITDVRNFGAIARSAECSGAHAIIIPLKGAAQVNGDALKASAGALYKIPVCRSANLKDTIEFLRNSGLQIVGCTEKSDKLYYEADLSLPTAIIIGSEEDGISAEYLKRCDTTVGIPVLGEIASLNASVAAGVILYDAVRQRTQKS